MNAWLPLNNISIPHVWLSVGESNQLSQESHMQIPFNHVGVQCKNDQGLALITRHAYASPVMLH